MRTPPGLDGPHADSRFDINGDGFAELTEWLDGTDGLLVDATGQSLLVGRDGTRWSGPWSGKNLFGSPGGYADGWQKLSLRDVNGNGRIAGEELDGLYVWQDLDADGRPPDAHRRT